MSRNSIINIITASILVLSASAYVINCNMYAKHFLNARINAVVVNSDDYQKRANKYIFADGNHVYMLAPWGDKMLIGDSISKPAGSSIYEVYRKDDHGVYAFYKKYDNNSDN